MNQELKNRLLWLSPFTFDGSHVGAFVRSTEMMAADIGLILVGSRMGVDCGGSLFFGTLILMGIQFAYCESNAIEPRTDWRRKWNLKQQNRPPVEAQHHEHHEAPHDEHH